MKHYSCVSRLLYCKMSMLSIFAEEYYLRKYDISGITFTIYRYNHLFGLPARRTYFEPDPKIANANNEQRTKEGGNSSSQSLESDQIVADSSDRAHGNSGTNDNKIKPYKSGNFRRYYHRPDKNYEQSSHRYAEIAISRLVNAEESENRNQ